MLLNATEYTVIRSLQEGLVEINRSSLECQFEAALDEGFSVVIVEPPGLGESCIRWIRVGNFLHKSAVLSALGTLIITPFIPRRVAFFTTFPLGVFGFSCVCLYTFSWQRDPCCKYQIDYKGRELTRIPSHEIHTPSPVVLVRRNDKYRKILHNTLSAIVVGYLGWMLYRHFNS